MIDSKKRIMIGMSGGVDSSVAAYLLKEQGYDVIGVTMLMCPEDTEEKFADAPKVCEQVGVPHHFFDVKKVFKEHVIDNFVQEYMAGRTPNPCVMCNSVVKWDYFVRMADELDCYYIATGHYCRIEENKTIGRYELQRGDDLKKDQSYFLYGMSQDALRRACFPLKDITKDKVRDIAGELGLETAQKKESMEICFITDNDYKSFLKRNVKDLSKIKPGEIFYKDGDKLKNRQHDGYPFYTIGQRKGLGGGFSEPMYVSGIDAETNQVYISGREGLYTSEVLVANLNWVSEEIKDTLTCTVKVRFNTSDKPAKVYRVDNDTVKVIFEQPEFAVAPGQSAVFYDGSKIVGGGVISKSK